MDSSQDADDGRQVHGRVVQDRLRTLNNHLSLLNHAIGARLGLRDVDVHCLDLVERHGPINPSGLARLAGLPPATMTGVLDRLQRDGWVLRERDSHGPDRRAVAVRVKGDRGPEVSELYAELGESLEEICANYSEQELELLTAFLDRVIAATRSAATTPHPRALS